MKKNKSHITENRFKKRIQVKTFKDRILMKLTSFKSYVWIAGSVVGLGVLFFGDISDTIFIREYFGLCKAFFTANIVQHSLQVGERMLDKFMDK